MRILIGLAGSFVLLLGAGPAPHATESALANDNRVAAGRMTNGVLTIDLEARAVSWYPEADGGFALPAYAFAEKGKPAQIPGPMIRVAVGTTVHASVRNTLGRPMVVRGLRARAAAVADTALVAPGETRQFHFVADAPGTFYYLGRTESTPALNFTGQGRDAMLLGAFIVDSANARVDPRERVLVLSTLADTIPELGLKSDAADRLLRRENVPRDRWFVAAVNGKSWPHTERLSYMVGDTVRIRLINGGIYPHPMHLHGFYYRVDARGDANRDTVYAASMRRDVVTEWMVTGTTMRMTWVPTRAGNWLFHCHLVTHMADALRLDTTAAPHGSHGGHAERGMAGLVTGIHVAPATGATLAAEPATRRRLRVFVTEKPNVYGTQPALAYVLQQGRTAPPRDSVPRQSSTLVLRQGEPTEIAVVNLSSQHTAVHWHGLELESFYDGVGGWSGWGARVAPMIAPGDSFVAQITPPRAGTFMYHTHADEGMQLASGLYGTLLVVPPSERGGADTTDRVVLIGMGGPHDEALPVINGASRPDTISIRAGRRHRLRIINISPMETRTIQLLKGDSVVQWRAVAKDGADLPPAQARSQPATVVIHAGETYDYEVERPATDTLIFRLTGPPTIADRMAFFSRARPGERPPRLVVDIPVVVR